MKAKPTFAKVMADKAGRDAYYVFLLWAAC